MGIYCDIFKWDQNHENHTYGYYSKASVNAHNGTSQKKTVLTEKHIIIVLEIKLLILQFSGPLSSKHRQMISKNPMFNGLSIPNQSQKSLKSLFPNL